MPNGRCRMHGGKTKGRPIEHGRTAKYTKIFGPNFAALVRDPELLNASAELALFDQYLTERAESIHGGVNSEWLHELRKAHHALHEALFVEREAGKVRVCVERLGEMIQEGGERQRAWEEVLAAARSRSEIAVKADAVLARREQTVSESDLLKEFVRVFNMVLEEAGPDVANRIRSRWEVEALGRLPARVGSGPAASPVH